MKKQLESIKQKIELNEFKVKKLDDKAKKISDAKVATLAVITELKSRYANISKELEAIEKKNAEK